MGTPGSIGTAYLLRFSRGTLATMVLALAIATITIWIALYYSTQPLLEHDAWRQTQNALTVYWMLEEGWRIAYQTPVLGYPWAIPLEFPIYQSIVAIIVWLTNLPLDPTGRIVSFVFLIACAWPAFQVAEKLRLPAVTPWLFCALLWSSPIYIFNGRSFGIETAALFFTFAAIPHALDLREAHPRLNSAFAFTCLSTLGMLQKVTTALPILVVLGGLLLVLQVRDHGLRFPDPRKLLIVLLSFAVPLLCTAFWFKFGESIRSQNQLIEDNINLVANWFGGNDRLALDIYRIVYWDRMFLQNAGGVIGASTLIGGIICGSSRERAALAIAVGMWFLTSFAFMRHHHFIYYYQTANTLYLIGAVSISIVAIACYFRRPILVFLLGAAIVASNAYFFYTGYWNYIQKSITVTSNTTLALGDIVRRYTPEDGAIIVFGLMSTGSVEPISAWSSEVAYYSERKSLTITDSARAQFWSDPAAFIGNKELGAIVFCAMQNRDRYEQILQKYADKMPPSLFKVKDCYVWLPGIASISLPNGKELHPTRSFQQRSG